METEATPPTKIVTTEVVVHVVVVGGAVARARPALANAPPDRAPSQLVLLSRDVTEAAVRAVLPIVAAHPTGASRRLAAPRIADHPPSTATLVPPSEHRHRPNLSPKVGAVNVAA